MLDISIFFAHSTQHMKEYIWSNFHDDCRSRTPSKTVCNMTGSGRYPVNRKGCIEKKPGIKLVIENYPLGRKNDIDICSGLENSLHFPTFSKRDCDVICRPIFFYFRFLERGHRLVSGTFYRMSIRHREPRKLVTNF